MSSAGDVNRDGFDDLIISAYGAGASYVVFGRDGGFAANLDLSSLDGDTGIQINGEVFGDGSGYSVSSAGDINGDGFDDLIIGAQRANPNGTDSGASYVVFGQAGGFGRNLDLWSLDGETGFEIQGEAAGDYSGHAVSSAGDVNGDGFDDLLIGAPEADPNGSASGASYVVFGQDSGFAAALDLSSLDGEIGFEIRGERAGDYSGNSVSSAGDVNGDGFDDLIIGANLADPNGPGSGASYVVFGQASGFAANLDLSSLDGSNGFEIRGEAAFDFSGNSVSSAGDVNGDGFDDLLIGAIFADPNGDDRGASYVVFGKAGDFAATLDLSTLDGDRRGFEIQGEAEGDFSGRSVSGAGDVNGDGFDDQIIGANGADPNGSNSGASYVIFGRAPEKAVTRIGSEADQTIRGGERGDILKGRAGDDKLFGAGDKDRLKGGDGEDRLEGGAGKDRLKGGEDADSFVFAPGSGRDNIRDFRDDDSRNDDVIDDRAYGFEHVSDIGRTALGDDLVLDFGGGTRSRCWATSSIIGSTTSTMTS